MSGDRAKIAAERQMRSAFHLGDDRSALSSARSTAATRAPAAAKASATSLPMPPAAPVDQDAFALQPERRDPTSFRLVSPASARRRPSGFLDIAGLRFADEAACGPRSAARGTARWRRRRSASAILSNQVSPTPSQAELVGDATLDRLKRRPRKPGSWRTISACGPVQWAKNSSRAHARLAANETDAPDHDAGPPVWASLKQLQSHAVMDAQIAGLGALIAGRRRWRPGRPGSPRSRRSSARDAKRVSASRPPGTNGRCRDAPSLPGWRR